MIQLLKNRFPFFLALFILGADIASKYATHLYLPLRSWYSMWYPYDGIGVFENFLGIEFSIIHATNKGAAWGMLSSFQDYLLIFRFLLITGLIVYVLFFNRNRNWVIPMTLIIAGALGNVVDYFAYGHVVDMLHFVLWGYDFPVFNLADVSIFLGVTSLFLISLFENPSPSKKSLSSKG
jgi:signal peptidase II